VGTSTLLGPFLPTRGQTTCTNLRHWQQPSPKIDDPKFYLGNNGGITLRLEGVGESWPG